jgi:hypothetical protein
MLEFLQFAVSSLCGGCFLSVQMHSIYAAKRNKYCLRLQLIREFKIRPEELLNIRNNYFL